MTSDQLKVIGNRWRYQQRGAPFNTAARESTLFTPKLLRPRGVLQQFSKSWTYART
jgi:hypothetical protein